MERDLSGPVPFCCLELARHVVVSMVPAPPVSGRMTAAVQSRAMWVLL